VTGFALGPAVIAARQAGLLLNGGGHAMAAGFTVSESRVEAFRDFLAERVHLVAGANGLVPELGLDGVLMPGAATPDFVTLLEQLAPFGAGNAEPRFAFPSMVVHRADVVGESHVRAILGEAAGPQRLKAIAFRTLDTELGRTLLDGRGRGFHVAGHLRRDGWQGRVDVQLLIDDAAVA
jgi:single-stranded-DNA-specific exonuclease